MIASAFNSCIYNLNGTHAPFCKYFQGRKITKVLTENKCKKVDDSK